MRILLFIALLFFCAQGLGQTPNLMPLPSSYKMLNEKFDINTTFNIEVKGDADTSMYKEATRFFQRLSERTGIFFPTWLVTPKNKLTSKGLEINIKSKGSVQLGMNESYALYVDRQQLKIDANTTVGGIRGLETLLQLLASDNKGYFFQGIEVKDEPRFSWRGLLISQPYHFMPMDVIKRTLDAMAAVKMNVLHFYISDDQGYRLESKVYPRLHEVASEGMYFSHEQVREMVAYANQRGIRVVPEIDVPGHSTAMIYAYPHLASIQREYELQDHWGVFDPTLDPTKSTTYSFLDSLLTEVASLFPDQYFHIGGDENTGRDWKKNPAIQSFMKEQGFKSTLDLQNYFNRKVQAILKKNGKIAVGWDEILMKEIDAKTASSHFQKGEFEKLVETSVPKDIVIQSWRGMEALLSSAKNGYKSILSKGYYIDLVQPASYHYLTDPLPYRNEVIVPDSEANFDRFESDIIKKIQQGEKLLTPDEEKLILGGEATMWTEHVSAETFDSRVWPRTAAIAERLWSPVEVRDVPDMYRRMDLISIQLESLGLTHMKNRDMMLRRLLGTEDVSSFTNIVQLLEPVQGYKRNRADNFTRFSPYSLMVDIAAPDQKAARDASALLIAPGITSDIIQLKRVECMFLQWIIDAKNVILGVENHPALHDLRYHAKSLKNLGEIGLNAIQQYNRNKVSAEFWTAERKQKIEKAEKEVGYCELKITAAFKQFIQSLGLK